MIDENESIYVPPATRLTQYQSDFEVVVPQSWESAYPKQQPVPPQSYWSCLFFRYGG